MLTNKQVVVALLAILLGLTLASCCSTETPCCGCTSGDCACQKQEVGLRAPVMPTVADEATDKAASPPVATDRTGILGVHGLNNTASGGVDVDINKDRSVALDQAYTAPVDRTPQPHSDLVTVDDHPMVYGLVQQPRDSGNIKGFLGHSNGKEGMYAGVL